jgi:hypothetical protein
MAGSQRRQVNTRFNGDRNTKNPLLKLCRLCRIVKENRETQSFGSYGDFDDTNDMDELPPFGACVGTLQKAAEMALADTSEGDPVFKFARAVKAFELSVDKRLPKDERPAAFNVWWSMANATAGYRPRGMFVFIHGRLRQGKTSARLKRDSNCTRKGKIKFTTASGIEI